MLSILLVHNANKIILFHILPELKLRVLLQEHFMGHLDINVLQSLEYSFIVNLLSPFLPLFEKVVIIEHRLKVGFGKELLAFFKFFQSGQ